MSRMSPPQRAALLWVTAAPLEQCYLDGATLRRQQCSALARRGLVTLHLNPRRRSLGVLVTPTDAGRRLAAKLRSPDEVVNITAPQLRVFAEVARRFAHDLPPLRRATRWGEGVTVLDSVPWRTADALAGKGLVRVDGSGQLRLTRKGAAAVAHHLQRSRRA